MPPERVQAPAKVLQLLCHIDGHDGVLLLLFPAAWRYVAAAVRFLRIASTKPTRQNALAMYEGTSPSTTYGVRPSSRGTFWMRHSPGVFRETSTSFSSDSTSPTGVGCWIRPT